MSWRHSSIAGPVALIALLGGASAPAAAQNTTPGGYSQDNAHPNGSISHGDPDKLSGDHKDVPPGRAKAQSESEALLKTLQIDCTVSNAALVLKRPD